jgi:site-specific DNA-methyltransferase (adenine-specific)
MNWNGLELPDKNVYFKDDDVLIYCADCREVLPHIPDKSIDLVLTDPPYGVTQNRQDICVDLSPLFALSKGQIIFSQQPFTTDVISEHRDSFLYDLIWDKILTSGFLNANRMPLRKHEVILLFGKVNYTPQKTEGQKSHGKGKTKENQNNNYGDYNFVDNSEQLGNLKHPTSILPFPKPHPSVALHRTEKPIELLEWLIKSYSVVGNLILDPFLGSGTTAYCAKKLGRKCIGIEIEEKYCEIAAKRLSQSVMRLAID